MLDNQVVLIILYIFKGDNMFERQSFNTRKYIELGYSTEKILSLRLQWDKDQDFLEEEYDREQRRIENSRLASIKYYADKEENGGSCITCGCKLTTANTSGYCQKHVSKAVLGLTDEEKAIRKAEAKAKPRIRYKTITFYGVKGNDLMDHSYYQGGNVSPR